MVWYISILTDMSDGRSRGHHISIINKGISQIPGRVDQLSCLCACVRSGSPDWVIKGWLRSRLLVVNPAGLWLPGYGHVMVVIRNQCRSIREATASYICIYIVKPLTLWGELCPVLTPTHVGSPDHKSVHVCQVWYALHRCALQPCVSAGAWLLR